MLKVKVTPELLVRMFTDGEVFAGTFLVNGGVPKGSGIVWVRPDVESRNEQEGSRWIEFFFATPDELRTQDRCVLLGRALGDMEVEEIVPTIFNTESTAKPRIPVGLRHAGPGEDCFKLAPPKMCYACQAALGYAPDPRRTPLSVPLSLATKLAALLEMHTEPRPGSDRDTEVVEALAQYERSLRG